MTRQRLLLVASALLGRLAARRDAAAMLPGPALTQNLGGWCNSGMPCNDGVGDSSDKCPLDANADQLDADGDGVGAAGDPDEFGPAKAGAGGCSCDVGAAQSRGGSAGWLLVVLLGFLLRSHRRAPSPTAIHLSALSALDTPTGRQL